MAGDKAGEDNDRHAGLEPFHSDSYDHGTWDNDLDLSPEIDWEKPPVYGLVGSGNKMSTTVVAQGEFRHLCHSHDGGKPNAGNNFNLRLDDGRVAISLLTSEKLPTPIPSQLQQKPYTIPNISNSKSPCLNIVIQIVGSRGKWHCPRIHYCKPQ